MWWALPFGAVLVAFIWAVVRAVRLRLKVDEERALRIAVERELISLQRLATRLHEEHQFLTHFLAEFPHLTRDLHSGATERKIPAALLNIIQRILEPKQAIVLLRRRHTTTDQGRSALLVVAATTPLGLARPGAEVPIGNGEIGFVAEVQRVMSRADFESQSPVTRARLRQGGVPGFEPHLVAPMVLGEETMGVLALSAPREDWPQAKAVLRVIAQIGALAIHDVDAYAQMKVTADVDGLTLLYNKRRMSQTLAEAILEAQQKMQSLAVFLFDLDHFKNYNDVNGHVAGDALLQVLARLVQDNTRRDNIIGRFGGEEFLVIFKGATAEHALQAAENLRTVIARHPFPFAGKQPLGLVSISGGVAEYPKDAMDSTGLLRAADAALYEAKRQGRNRVLVATPRYLSEDEPVIGSGVEDMDEDFDEAPPKKSASNG